MDKIYNFTDIFTDKSKILFVMAHPDDAEAYFGGTIALLAQDGKELKILITTTGGRGSQVNDISEADLIKMRERETTRAMRILGVKKENLNFLPYLDGDIYNDLDFAGNIVKVIREFKPEIVATHHPEGYIYQCPGGFSYVHHRDHRATGRAVIDAVYPLSRDRSFYPEHSAEGIESHQVNELLLTGDAMFNCEIDISSVSNLKQRALLEHQSQFKPEEINQMMSCMKLKSRFFERASYHQLAHNCLPY